MTDLSLNVTRGDAILMHIGHRFTLRFHLRLDQVVNPEIMRRAIDKTAKRYPYFCVTLKKNEKEFYYEPNDAPIALLHTTKRLTLVSEETNGHIWAVCYDEDNLFLDIYHGRTDSTGAYFLLATLLYYYFGEQYDLKTIEGIRTLETEVSEQETHDPVNDLPLIDLSSIQPPPPVKAFSLMEKSGLQISQGKIIKLTVDEADFVAFAKANNATPGLMVCALMCRALERIHPKREEPLICNYTVNARPMLHATETFHNCLSRVTLQYDKVSGKPLNEQCAVFRAETKAQTDEKVVQRAMTFAGSFAQMILNTPILAKKMEIARQNSAREGRAASVLVSYVGKWKYDELGQHVKELWTESSTGRYPVVELAAIGGKIFISLLQLFEEPICYQALLEELKQNGIKYTECGEKPISIPDVSLFPEYHIKPSH